MCGGLMACHIRILSLWDGKNEKAKNGNLTGAINGQNSV